MMDMESLIKKPWGSYQVLSKGDGYKIKRIVVFPNSQLSLQSHNKRSEIWIITDGNGVVVKNENNFCVEKFNVINIKVKEKHRISNFYDKNLVFIEIQLGDYLEEDDIIRYQDIYGRL